MCSFLKVYKVLVRFSAAKFLKRYLFVSGVEVTNFDKSAELILNSQLHCNTKLIKSMYISVFLCRKLCQVNKVIFVFIIFVLKSYVK